jgi:hypothetical protein
MLDNSTCMTQLKDGRWVPAQPVPFYNDGRPWYVRIWHALLFWRDEDELIETWWVPVEPGNEGAA